MNTKTAALLVSIPRTLLFWVLITASALLLFSCETDEVKTTFRQAEGSLVLTPCVTEMATKSQITSAENKLSEASVAVYTADGNFVRSVHATDMEAIEFPLLHIGETYHVYAAFNMGDLAFPVSESDIASLTHTWNVSGMNSKGLPMVWTGTVDMTSATQSVPMAAVRLVSKVTFRVDNSGLSDHNGTFTVSSVKLKNATKTVSVFSAKQSLKGEEDCVCDSATASDVTSVNGGSRISFYTFENACGTLLSGNTDPWKKIPGNIGDDNASKCTYLEVAGTYSTDGGSASVPVTYRMYLGENATTNFDLLRNYIYDVTLLPSDEGIGSTSWKVTRGSFSDSRTLVFTPASVTMNLGGSATFTVTPTPSDMVYTVEGGSGFASSTLTLAPTGNANEYSLVSSGTLTADASTSVVATSWDGRVTASLPVTVKAKLLKSIAITPASIYKSTGETQAYAVTATYDNGGTEETEDVTSEAAYTSSKTDVAVMGTDASKHIATAVSGGTSTITASFGGKTATAQFNTRYPVALKVSCPGYQSGTETAPVWKIDWADVPKSDPKVPYTVTAVYDDGTEKENVQSLCTASQTYITGTAGEGNCFTFDKGTITQADGGHQDTGGNGTVTFSYTEAGRTAELDVEWWKLYVTSVAFSVDHFIYNRPRNYKNESINCKYNDNSDKNIGVFSDSKVNLGTLTVDAGYSYYAEIRSDDTINALRYGTALVTSTGDYRGVHLSQFIWTNALSVIRESANSFLTLHKGVTYYCAYQDVDGVHLYPEGHIEVVYGDDDTPVGRYDEQVTAEQLYEDIIVANGFGPYDSVVIKMWSVTEYTYLDHYSLSGADLFHVTYQPGSYE